MLVSDIWIIHESGLCYYHYQSPFSTSDEFDSDLFGGFIAALSAFTKPLSNKAIDFLKMQNEQLHFVIIDGIIVTSLVNELEDIDQEAIIQLLTYIGDKFIEKYSKYLDGHIFDWALIENEFTEEISFLISKDTVIEEMRRERISNLVNDVIMEKITPVNLVNSISKLYSNAKWHEIAKAKGTIDNISNILPTLKYDVFLEAKISNALRKTIDHLDWLAKLKLPMNQFFVYCEDSQVFERLFNLCLSYNAIPVQFNNMDSLTSAILKNSEWNNSLPFNNLILSPNIRTKDVTNLIKLSEKKIYIFLNEELNSVLKSIADSTPEIEYNQRHCNFENSCKQCFEYVDSIFISEIERQLNEIENEQEAIVK
jgi:hypothetical protein